jgi:tetratricopeptide (TPR) repeat protein
MISEPSLPGHDSLQIGSRPSAGVAIAPASHTVAQWAANPSAHVASVSIDWDATLARVPTGSDAVIDTSYSDSRPTAQASSPALNDYEILSTLGEGGMGVVYKARQRPPLNRLVALKMIRPGCEANPDQLARFRIEAEAVARLHHPHIVQIFAIGEVGGVPFFSLELLEGGSLRDRLARTPQPGKAAATLMVTLARAMDAAHRAGIVHRDLKPGNVLFDGDGTPKITDFGLAKRLERADGLTETGELMGTPCYMAPEQALGQTRLIGPAADVYALGAILYEMLTGRPPFKGPTTFETLRQVVHEEPVPPSRLQPRVARDLETICLKCLAKEPHRRYPSAAALADDLGRYLAGKPVRARQTPAWESGWKWACRHPTTATLLATAALAVGVLAGTWIWYADRIERGLISLRAEADRELVKVQEALARGDDSDGKVIAARLLVKIEHEPRLADRRARAIAWRDRIEQRLAHAASARDARARHDRFLTDRLQAHFYGTKFTGLDPSKNLEAIRGAARAALREFANEESEDSWMLPSAPSTPMPGQWDEIVEGCYEMLLVLAEAESQPLANEDPHRQAERGLRLLASAARLRTAPSRAFHLRRAVSLLRAGDAEAAEHERELAAGLEPTSPFDHFLDGQERYERGDWPAAMREFDAVLQAQPDHFSAQFLLAICQLNADPPRLGEARAGLTACLQRRPELPWLHLLRGFASGQMGVVGLRRAEAPPDQATSLRQEAEALFNDAEVDYRQADEQLADGPVAELRYILHVNRGVLRLQRRRWTDAVADLHEAIRLNSTRYFPYDALSQVYQQQGRLDEALAELNQAIQCQPDRADLYRKRARLRARRREIDPALRDVDEAILREVPGSPAQAHDQTERGRLLHADDRLEEALDAYDAALKVLPRDAETHRLRVDVLLKLKRHDEVIAACDASLADGPPSADLYALRGLARFARRDYSGAIADDTQALVLRPGSPRVLVERGWAYLFSGAEEAALRDFQEAIDRDPTDADAYTGRGNVLVRLLRHREAVADALEALRCSKPGTRASYNAARIFSQAAAVALTNVDRRGQTAAQQVASGYLDRAVTFLRQAIEPLTPGERAAFWRDAVLTDPALLPLRRCPRFARLAAELHLPSRERKTRVGK